MDEERDIFDKEAVFENRQVAGRREARERAVLYRERFYDLVERALDELPEEFKARLENLDIVIADWPSPAQ
ncbi:MAG: hypothetical protein IBX68_05845, partial [Dehalococcoidia bacterium]|nr:hypothetical protein [Dehalococcoidia bacterium]